jgi:membrane-bound serine protease (ClpP class)
MRLRIAVFLVFVGLGLLAAGPIRAAAQDDDPYVALVTIAGGIDRISAGYLSRGIREASEGGAELVVVNLDTPGGFLSSTRDMVESILSAEIPVAVYVSPPGARAASAGTFITAAANFAVMAPGTNIGAASPIAAGGADLPETLAKKINEDTRAFIRSIAVARGRNSEALEETVTVARSYSAAEAIDLNVVDIIAADMADLLVQLDGRTAQTAVGPVVLRTRNADVREIKKTLLEKFLGVVADPNLAFILLTIGGLGILAEFLTPGFIGPGVVGAIALALAFLGMGQLSVNWIGAGLILFAMVLFFLEAQEVGIGILGIGGVISFLLGAFLLFGGYFSSPDISEPGSGVSVWLIGGFGGGMGAVLATFLYLIRPTGSSSGDYSMPGRAPAGQVAVVLTDLNPIGKVRIGDEEWDATTDLQGAIPEGEEVRVLEAFGAVLKVTRIEEEVSVKRWAGIGKLFNKRDR